MSPAVDVNPFSPEFQEDPYPWYHRLRATDPVHPMEVMGMRLWALTRHADVLAALRDPRLSSAAVPRELLPRELADGNMFYKDPPDHTRLRNLVGKAFQPHLAESMRPRVQAIADALLDAMVGRHRMEVVAEFAVPLSLSVVCEILGVPVSDRRRLKRWSDDLAVLLDGTRMIAGIGNAPQSAREFIDYLRGVIDDRRRDPRGDLISSLVAAREAGDRLTDDEMIATSLFTLVAGHETVTHLIGNGLLALFAAPAELDRLRRAPRLIPTAVEELLRFDAPVQLTIKLARTDLEIGGRPIRSGEPVCALLGAANRDPEVFPDPDRLDLSRADNHHLAFGHGAHYCVGGPLARIEAQVAFATLLRRLPELHAVDGGRVRQPGVVLRGLKSLEVGF